jgi:hypothetical protein
MAIVMFVQVSIGSPKVSLCNQLLPQTSYLLSHTSPLRDKILYLSCNVMGWGLLPNYSNKTDAKQRVCILKFP